MTKLSGYLEDAVGIAIPNCTIELKAQKTTLSVITKTSAFSAPNGEGYYEMEVKPGQYLVTLLMDGYSPKQIGEITIYLDSPDGTLNDFLLVPNSNEIKPELITALEQVRYENKLIVEKAKQEVQQLAKDTQDIAAQTKEEIQKSSKLAIDAKNAAEQAKNEAQNSLSNVVKKSGEDVQNIDGALSAHTLQENGVRVYSPNNIPSSNDVGALSLSGGVITGDLNIKKDSPFLQLQNDTDTYFFNIRAANGNNTQIGATGSDGVSRTRLKWDSSINQWNFENSNVAVNNTSILKQGDYGLGTRSPLLPAGTDFSSDLVTASNNEFTLSGKYIGTPDDSKTWGGTLTVKRRLYDVSGACTLILFHEGNYYIKYGHKNTGLWVWSNWEKIILSSGGALTGDLNINKVEPAIVFNSGNDSFRWFLGQNNTSGFQGMGNDGLKTRFRWKNATKTWDFESCNVTKNGANLLSQGDYGVGNLAPCRGAASNKFTDNLDEQWGGFKAIGRDELPPSFEGLNGGFMGITMPYSSSAANSNNSWVSRLLVTPDINGYTTNIPTAYLQQNVRGKWSQLIEIITTANISSHLPKMEVLYPQGTEANPPIISINSRIVIDNPFPGHSVICIVEVKFKDKWGAPGFIYSAGGYGVKAHQYDDDQIIVQSGNIQVLNGPQNTGSPHPTASLTSAPFRVKVWKLT